MAWWRTPRVPDPHAPLRRRLTRLRRLNRCYRGFLGLFVDAAEKQGGGFILDRQYIVSLGERAFRLGYEIVFHSNVLQPGVAPESYAALDRLKADLRALFAGSRRPPDARGATAPPDGGGSPPESGGRSACPQAETRPGAGVAPGALREGRLRRVRLIDSQGYVASPGVAAGPVHLVETEADLRSFPADGVLVARRLEPTAALLRTLPRVGAILVEEATPADPIAALARAFRVPALLGLPAATSRLPPGELVTVDASDASVYVGVFEELLQHHRLQGSAREEAPEDRLLNSVLLELGSPLSAAAHPAVAREARRSLCGIVQRVYTVTLAQCAADALRPGQGHPAPAAGFSGGLRTVDLCLPLPGRQREEDWTSGPCAWLLAGLVSSPDRGEGAPVAGQAHGVVYRSEEAATALLLGEDRTLLLEAMITGGAEGNHVMVVACAGAPSASEGELDGMCAEALRLGLMAIRAGGTIAAWQEHIPQASAEETLRRVGQLARRYTPGPGVTRETAGRG